MRNRRNYYRILHVQPDAPGQVIRSSYRTLMAQLDRHPDRGGDHAGAALINEAYEVLSDPLRRSAYDRELERDPSRLGFRREAFPGGAAAGRRPVETAPVRPPPAAPESPACPFCRSACRPETAASPAGRCHACDSPLFPVGRVQFEASGQRAAGRRAHRQPVRVSVRWPDPSPVPAVVRDVSPRGLRLDAGRPLEVGRVVKIAGSALHATGRVVYCRGEPRGDAWSVGVECLTILVEPGSFVSRRS